MNGDTQLILQRLSVIETKQNERHRENKSDIKVIFKKFEPLESLPEKLKNYKIAISTLWGLYLVLLIYIVLK